MNPIVPAGHSKAIADQAYIAEQPGDLENALLEFQKLWSKWEVAGRGGHYNVARELLGGLQINLGELHGTILRHQESLICEDGLFVSAAYSLCEDKIIPYDLDLPLHFIGCHLPKDKLLINRRNTAAMGYFSKGVIVNCGKTSDEFGFGAEGVLVRADDEWFDWNSQFDSSCIAVSVPNYQVHSATGNRAVLYRKKCHEELIRQIDSIMECCNGPTDKFYARYGSEPAITIQEGLRSIMEVHG